MKLETRAALVLLFAAIPIGAQTPGPRPLSIEDYYRFQTIGDIQISPDGRRVAYTVSSRIEDDNSTQIRTYVVSVDGMSSPRLVQPYGRDIASPRWTADNQLSFSENSRVPSAIFIGGPDARRGESPRFRIDLDAKDASPVPMSAAPPGITNSAGWRAEAKDGPRAPRAEPQGTDFEKRHAARFRGRAFDWMRFQQDGQDFPVPDPRLRPAAEITLTAPDGAMKAITKLGMRPANLAWRPDGTTVAFTAEEDWRNEQGYENPDIYTVTTEGIVTRLTTDGHVWSGLAYSPDGKFLLAERTFGTTMIIAQRLNHGGSDDLILYPTDGSAPINLTNAWDLEPNAPRWSKDGRFVYFTAEHGGTTHLFRVAPRAGAAVEQVTKGDRRIGSVTFDEAMNRIAYSVGTYDAPSEVWTANIDGSGERKLTNVFESVRAQIAITRTERMSWKSKDGAPIEGWLTLPYGYDAAKGPYPLVVFNHGGPHSAVGYGFNFKQQYFAANGYFVFDTNFRGSTGYGDAFKWATWGGWGNKDGEDVISGIDHVLSRFPIDPKKVATMGHSYGGFMTNWLIAKYPDRFAAAAAGASISNWFSDYGTADIYRTKETEFWGAPWDERAIPTMVAQSPLMQAGRVRTPTLFIHGEADERVPYEEGEQMYFALRRRGVPAKMIQYAGQPHGISGHWNNVHRMLNELAWFETHVKGAKSAPSAPR